MRNIVNEDSAGAALRPVAPQLRASEPELVAQRPRQRFLLRDVGPPLLPVYVDCEEPFTRAGSRLTQESGGAEKIACGGDCRAAYDDSLYYVSSCERLWRALNRFWIFNVAHLLVLPFA